MRSHRIQRAVRRSDLTLAESILMNALIDLVDWQTWSTLTTLKVLTNETRLNKATITKRLKYFESKGFIKRKRNGDERGFTRTAYEIQIDTLEAYLSQWMPKNTKKQDTPLVASGDKVGASGNPLGASSNPLGASGAFNGASGNNPMVPQATTNQPSIINLNSNLDNQPSNSSKDNARGASLEGVKKEVRRIPAGQFGAGAILIDGDDWEPGRKTNSNQAWIEGGWTPPSREERLKAYK